MFYKLVLALFLGALATVFADPASLRGNDMAKLTGNIPQTVDARSLTSDGYQSRSEATTVVTTYSATNSAPLFSTSNTNSPVFPESFAPYVLNSAGWKAIAAGAPTKDLTSAKKGCISDYWGLIDFVNTAMEKKLTTVKIDLCNQAEILVPDFSFNCYVFDFSEYTKKKIYFNLNCPTKNCVVKRDIYTGYNCLFLLGFLGYDETDLQVNGVTFYDCNDVGIVSVYKKSQKKNTISVVNSNSLGACYLVAGTTNFE